MVREIREYIDKHKKECYHFDIPDSSPKEIYDKVPSYERIAKSILKNDLRDLGVAKKSKWYSELKKIELEDRKRKIMKLKDFKTILQICDIQINEDDQITTYKIISMLESGADVDTICQTLGYTTQSSMFQNSDKQKIFWQPKTV